MIDPDSPLHEYQQLAAILRDQIKRGELSGRLPSIPQLAEQFSLSEATVKRSLAVLSDDDLIYSVRGRGTFVKPPEDRYDR